MSNDNVTLNYARRPTFQILRTLFICGHLIYIVLTFVPTIKVSPQGMYGSGKVQEQTYSAYELIRFLGESEQFGWQIFYVVVFALDVAFVILAITYPKRWVFISGASMTAFFLLWDLFTPPKEGIVGMVIPNILDYVASAFVLLGFIAKPTSTTSRNG